MNPLLLAMAMLHPESERLRRAASADRLLYKLNGCVFGLGTPEAFDAFARELGELLERTAASVLTDCQCGAPDCLGAKARAGGPS